MGEIHARAHLGGAIAPEDVVLFAPGRITAEGQVTRSQKRRIFYRDFAYSPQAVTAPGIDSILMVVYRQGETLMRRRAESGWCNADVGPGTISLLAARQSSDWEWAHPISVSHLYLSPDLLADTAAAAFDRDYERFEMVNRLDTADPTLRALADAIASEIRHPGAASQLLIDSLTQALSLHLLRAHHADCGRLLFRTDATERLTPIQRRLVVEQIETRLAENVRLADIARAAGLTETILLKRFRATFGTSPHQYFVQRRVDRAVDLIRTTAMPLAEIAHATGFSDQAHMNRMVKKCRGQTPGALRRE